MPELPEVETVRRGLEPVMQDARFDRVEARRGDLRWPLPKDFGKRLEGTRVTGIGRRGKYLLVDLSSGEVLIMHLGMSGSFHVFRDGDRQKPGRYHHERAKHAHGPLPVWNYFDYLPHRPFSNNIPAGSGPRSAPHGRQSVQWPALSGEWETTQWARQCQNPT